MYRVDAFEQGIVSYRVQLTANLIQIDRVEILTSEHTPISILNFFSYDKNRVYMVFKHNSKVILRVIILINADFDHYYTIDPHLFSAIDLKGLYLYYIQPEGNQTASTLWKAPIRSITAIEDINFGIGIQWDQDLLTLTELSSLIAVVTADGEEVSNPQSLGNFINVTQGYVLPLIYNLEVTVYRTYNTRNLYIQEKFLHTNYPEEIEVVYSIEPVDSFRFPEGLKLGFDSMGMPRAFIDVPYTYPSDQYRFNIKIEVGGSRVYYKPIILIVLR